MLLWWFQSLFCWTAESNYKQSRLSLLFYFVSILVLLDSRIKPTETEIQNALQACFNPCFVGQQNQTISIRRYFWIISLFQSLFCWTAESNNNIPFLFWLETVVSILVLLDSRIKRLQRRKPWITFLYVSILVLLDSRIKRNGNTRRGRRKYVSILVLLDSRIKPLVKGG